MRWIAGFCAVCAALCITWLALSLRNAHPAPSTKTTSAQGAKTGSAIATADVGAPTGRPGASNSAASRIDANGAPPRSTPGSGVREGPVVRWADDVLHEGAVEYDHAQTAVRAHPDSPAVWRELARLARARSDWTTAAAALERLSRLEPGDVDAVLQLCDVRLKQGALVAAAEVLESALSRGLRDCRLSHNLAVAQQQLRWLPEARAAWTQALECDPCNSEALLQRACVLLDLNEPAAAEVDLRRVLDFQNVDACRSRKRPDAAAQAAARDNLALALTRQGRQAEAEQVLPGK